MKEKMKEKMKMIFSRTNQYSDKQNPANLNSCRSRLIVPLHSWRESVKKVRNLGGLPVIRAYTWLLISLDLLVVVR